MKLEDFLKGTFKYDQMGQVIFIVQPNGNHQRILDLRGHGAIQGLFKNKAGEVDIDSANKFQDEIGELIVKKLNKP